MAHFKAESCFTADIPCRKLKIPSGVKKKIFWSTMRWWFSVSDLQGCGLIARELWKHSWRKYCQTAQICYIGKFWGFHKMGKRKVEKHYSTDRSVRLCSFHHEVYKSLFVLGWMWYRCVVRHKWFSKQSSHSQFANRPFTDQLAEISH